VGLPDWHSSRCSGRKGWPTSPRTLMMGSRCTGWGSPGPLGTSTSLVKIQFPHEHLAQHLSFLLIIWLLMSQNKAELAQLKQNEADLTP